MVVPATADVDRGVLFSRILCPTDGSAASSAAVALAVSLARETDGAITLMQVVEPLPAMSEIAAVDTPAYEMRAEAEARAMLQAAVAADVREWCRIEEVVVIGQTSDRILAVARDRAADIIVMGVRGRNAVDLLTFGSTTNAVVRRARCPVLVVHPQAVAQRPATSASAAAGA
jgi:nucleotide-binding universal stress UspA family protein